MDVTTYNYSTTAYHTTARGLRQFVAQALPFKWHNTTRVLFRILGSPRTRQQRPKNRYSSTRYVRRHASGHVLRLFCCAPNSWRIAVRYTLNSCFCILFLNLVDVLQVRVCCRCLTPYQSVSSHAPPASRSSAAGALRIMRALYTYERGALQFDTAVKTKLILPSTEYVHNNNIIM